MSETGKSGAGRGYHHGDLRAALVTAARAILEEAGLSALSLRAVARRAAVSQAAPYHHFADKNALLAAVAAEGFDGLTEAMQRRMAGFSETQDRLEAAGVAYVLFAVANPALFQLMFYDGKALFPGNDGLAAAGARAYAVLDDAVAANDAANGVAHGQGIGQTAAWSIVHGLAKLILEVGLDPEEQGAKDVEDLARQVLARMRWR